MSAPPGIRVVSIWLCVALLLQATTMQSVAADFSKAKQVYVPPTRFPRNSDYESQRELESLKGTAAARHAMPLGGRAGSVAGSVGTHKLSAAEVTQLRLRAESLMKRGNLEQSNQLLKQCFAAQSTNSLVQNDLLKVNLSRSRQFEKSKKLDQAIAASREAIYFSPNNLIAAALLTRQLKKKGFDASNADVRLELAQKLFARGRLAPALVEYCQSYKLRPAAAACVGLGNVYLNVGKSKLANQQYTLALQIDPSCAEAHRQLGLMCLADKDIVGANSYLGKALELNGNDMVASKALIDLWKQQVSRSPNSANAHLGLARAYQLSGKFDLAGSEYDTVAEIEPDNHTLSIARATLQRVTVKRQSAQAMEAARTLESQGALEEAKNKIGEALAVDPKNTNLLFLQGELLEKMGKAADAADVYRAVLYADPNNAEATARLKSLNDGKFNFSSVGVPMGSDVVKLTNFMLDMRNYVGEKAVKTAKHESSKPKS